ncbi:hypothetical protein NDU88_005049 [Pleurodeles waltl]|uniref:Uncharacterized protein n=1 Tax=Pleurodeles waltl TaxID=8319 RepID=A0AAV7W9N3_PLEWA|nr:hypothetical protein NDU88_005049 [Pleurodeles waltl]
MIEERRVLGRGYHQSTVTSPKSLTALEADLQTYQPYVYEKRHGEPQCAATDDVPKIANSSVLAFLYASDAVLLP